MIFVVSAVLLLAAFDAWRTDQRLWLALLLLAIVPTLSTSIGFIAALLVLVVYATLRIATRAATV
jgi:hypothetical protein